ncbi:sialidase family protein [Lignipirellula cremea]|uniref:exo-alpha-sialidase n=1 Tax=Lignipirellula cremea TaxID=2528010 RepID=A0A518DQ36_9BACT|nr:sialidase family protein [Lignipirellula cremea]QDU93959.1 Sialidase precursor [Lignipirellula cremea]
MRTFLLAATCLLTASLLASGAEPEAVPFQTDVFEGGQGGYHAYRIPSLVTTPDGALLLFCEARKASLSDDGDIDLLMRRSEDGGRTWQEPQLLREEGGDAPVKFGNPTAVVDRETKVIWLAVNRDVLDPQGARGGGSLELLRSDDDGKTWSLPIDISAAIKRADWRHYAFGPGIGVQLEHGPHRGRLILSANYRTSFNKRTPSWSHILYSDDHGETWRRGGQLGQYTNECQVVETLAGGKSGLLFNARNHWGRAGSPEKSGHRLVARSQDGGATWADEAMDPALSDPPCQASLFRYSWPTAAAPGRILFANPAGPGRSHLTLRQSRDEGRTWPVAKVLCAESSAYSCITRLADGQVGVIFERDNYRKLTFVSFPLAWLDEPDSIDRK